MARLAGVGDVRPEPTVVRLLADRQPGVALASHWRPTSPIGFTPAAHPVADSHAAPDHGLMTAAFNLERWLSIPPLPRSRRAKPPGAGQLTTALTPHTIIRGRSLCAKDDTMPERAYLPGTSIELCNPAIPQGQIRFCLFDFDGTLSLIREGWQDVMVPMMVEVLSGTPRAESREALFGVVRDYVDRLTGKQTIYQMLQLVEEVKKRGGTPKDALAYKHDYLALLWERIQHRVADLKAGRAQPDEYLVAGSVKLLTGLRDRGVTLYLASGTDMPCVLDEAEALGLTGYFDGGIYGALDNWESFSKRMLIQDLVQRFQLRGPQFLTFGDGFVEIENCKEVGGIAVGVASDEARRSGVDEWKRNRLIGAGADMIIPDFREADALLGYLFP